MRITFLLGFFPNQRMNKRMRILQKDNDISLIYWQKSDDIGAYGTDIATQNNTCIDIRFNESSLKERFLALQRFKKVAAKELDRLKPDCIYVQNLDLFLFAEDYKRQHHNSIHLVYEVSDINDLLIQPQKNVVKKTVQKYLQKKEKKACHNVDLFCYTSPAFCTERYGSIVPEDRRMYLPNIPDLTYFDTFTSNPWDNFTIGYVGTLRYEKQLRLMLDAANEAGIKALIAGGVASGGSRGNQIDLKRLKEDYPNAIFIGAFDYPSEIAKIYSRINVSFAVYDNKLNNVKVALPNKLYEGIRCRIPIIVAPDTFLAETVVKLGVGVAMSDKQSIVDFLIRLKNEKSYYMDFQKACETNSDFIDAGKINETFCSWFNKMSEGERK